MHLQPDAPQQSQQQSQYQQPRQQPPPQQPQQRRDQNYPPHPYAGSSQPPPPQTQPARQNPASAPPPTSAPDRGTVKLAPHAEKDNKTQYPAAYYDPNDPQRTVHVWNSVRKLPKEMMQQQQQQQQQQPNAGQPEDGDGELEPDVEGNAMLEGVILPAFEHVGSRIPDAIARQVLERCRDAFIEAERLIPGVSSAFVLEIVENVEQVDEHDQ